jgi:hypothetical protein
MIDKVETLYCANHPNTETSLRCSRCEKPICSKCAVLTPTGYKCRECVRGMQKTFETTHWYDYPVMFLIALLLSFAGSFMALFLGFFTIFLAPAAGTLIAEVIRKVVRRRRSLRLFRMAALATALGAGLQILMNLNLVAAVFAGGFNLFGMMRLLWLVLYAVLATSTMYYRLSGIRL